MATPTKPLVAIVDDEPTICGLLEELLTDEGYRITCYTESSAFIDELAHQIPDMLLLDLHMPGQPDGWEVLAEVRSRPVTSSLPVILNTAYPRFAELHAYQLQTPNTMYLEKPFEINELLDMVRQALRKRPGAQG